mmetsp:Transcript_40103/g.159500  ORF Transcript_40103/g.159500 Transcript_40103/m.159500 type:complete len:498 (-) Transcript_40103:1373-2866(-)
MESGAEDSVIAYLRGRSEDGWIESSTLAEKIGVDHQVLVDSALKALTSREAILTEMITHSFWKLSDEGQIYAENGTPEAQVFASLASPMTLDQLKEKLGNDSSIGMQQAMKKKWIVMDKGTKTLSRKVDTVVDEVADILKKLAIDGAGEGLAEKDLKVLKSRKLIVHKPYKTYNIKKSDKFDDATKKQATELTREMLESGEWKDLNFKSYNFEALGKAPEGGSLHPLLKVREQFRSLFLEMGFEEMPTNNYVESSFWNFDALFQPQQHPARDAHDTFFLSAPELSKIENQDYWNRVQKTHEEGGYGSIGYRYKWSEQEAKKNVLRTHTTAVSSRMLQNLGSTGAFKPKKYFSIDRVFRNETLDATHLAEFHQIEGVIADRNLSLGHLKGILHLFFQKLGMPKLRFKPAHNPYTEPSMEIFSYHEGLKKWVEVGNSGIFRPEMLQPMGLPEDVTVIAWGLSLERPTMILYGISNIRELFGHKVDLEKVKRNPICRLTF